MKTISSVSIIAVAAMAALVLVFVTGSVSAQIEYGDRQPSKTKSKRLGTTASITSSSQNSMNHVGDSPFPVPTPTDTNFVVDTGFPTGLDTACKFRDEGSLKFQIEITRYVGAVNGQGKLLNPTSLINNKIISPTATLTLPAFDVDYSTTTQPPHQPERDRVFLNGEPIGDLGAEGFLDGENERWRMNTLRFKIDKLKFAQKNGSGPPTPGINEIEVLIDQGNISNGLTLWCTSIDWAALTFKALDPIIMIHGNGSSKNFWTDEDFVVPFNQTGTPYDNSITMPTTAVANNAATLKTEIKRIADEFGVRHVHLVCHSKGGLDTRAFLKLIPVVDPDVAIMSVTTLSTPHHGSALADYIRDVQTANADVSDNPKRAKLFQRWGGTFDEGRRNLTTEWVAGFNKENLPLPQMFSVSGEENGVNYFAFSADANANDSFEDNDINKPTIQFHELIGTGFGAVAGHIFTGGGTVVYQTLYHVASTHLGVDSQGRTIVVEVENKAVHIPLQRNDMLVTERSATPSWFLALPQVKKNHATVGDEEMGQAVLLLIRSIRPLDE